MNKNTPLFKDKTTALLKIPKRISGETHTNIKFTKFTKAQPIFLCTSQS